MWIVAALLGSRAGDETHPLRSIFTHSAAWEASLLECLKGTATYNSELVTVFPVPCSSRSHVMATSPFNCSGQGKKLEVPRSPWSWSHTLCLISQEMAFSSCPVHLQSDPVSLCLSSLRLPWSTLPSLPLLISMLRAL